MPNCLLKQRSAYRGRGYATPPDPLPSEKGWCKRFLPSEASAASRTSHLLTRRACRASPHNPTAPNTPPWHARLFSDAATAATDSRSIGDRLSSGPSSASDPLTCLAHHVHRCRHANFAHGGRRPSRGRREHRKRSEPRVCQFKLSTTLVRTRGDNLQQGGEN